MTFCLLAHGPARLFATTHTQFAVLCLVLIYCERKVLLAGWWLLSSAGLV